MLYVSPCCVSYLGGGFFPALLSSTYLSPKHQTHWPFQVSPLHLTIYVNRGDTVSGLGLNSRGRVGAYKCRWRVWGGFEVYRV